MALTRDFKETILARVQREPKFAHALLQEALDLLLNGEPDTAKLIFRDLINATVGFEKLAEMIDKPSKSIHRMFSANGNPTINSLSAILEVIRQTLNVQIHTKTVNLSRT